MLVRHLAVGVEPPRSDLDSATRVRMLRIPMLSNSRSDASIWSSPAAAAGPEPMTSVRATNAKVAGDPVRAIITTELAGTNPSNAGIAAKTSVAVLKRMFCMSFPLL